MAVTTVGTQVTMVSAKARGSSNDSMCSKTGARVKKHQCEWVPPPCTFPMALLAGRVWRLVH